MGRVSGSHQACSMRCCASWVHACGTFRTVCIKSCSSSRLSSSGGTLVMFTIAPSRKSCILCKLVTQSPMTSRSRAWVTLTGQRRAQPRQPGAWMPCRTGRVRPVRAGPRSATPRGRTPRNSTAASLRCRPARDARGAGIRRSRICGSGRKRSSTRVGSSRIRPSRSPRFAAPMTPARPVDVVPRPLSVCEV